MKKIFSWLLIITLFLGMLPAGFADAAAPIKLEIKTSEAFYKPGSNVGIEISLNQGGKAYEYGTVQLQVQDPQENLVFVKQVVTDGSGKSVIQFKLNSNAIVGSYDINANIGTEKVQKKFEVKSHGVDFKTDKPTYVKGSKVIVEGTLTDNGNLYPYGAAVIKVIQSETDKLVYIKEVIADEKGCYNFDFNLIGFEEGTYLVKQYFNGKETTQSIKVSNDVVAYQIDCATDKAQYKGGDVVKVKGTASTTKNGVKIAQEPIKVIFLTSSHGKTLETKNVNVASDGTFAVEFKLENKTAQYNIVLTNGTAKKILDFGADEVKSNVTPTPTPTPGGGGSTVGGGGAAVSGPSTPPAKSTSTNVPVMGAGNSASVSVAVKPSEPVNQKSTATIGAEDVKKAMESLGKTGATAVELRFEVAPTTASVVEVKIPVAEIKTSAKQTASVVVVTNGVSVKVPMTSVHAKSATDTLNVQVEKVEFKNLTLAQGAIAKDSFKISAVMSTGEKIADKALELKVDLANYKLDFDKVVLVKVGADGKQEIVGNKVIKGSLAAIVSGDQQYALVERTIDFKDLNKHWSEKYVESMASKGIVAGYDNGGFDPEKSVTRAEFATMLVKALDLELTAQGNAFTDVSAKDWSKAYVETAYAMGIVKGANGKFNPNAKISRAEMAVMISNALKLSEQAPTAQTAKVDNTVPKWAATSVELVKAFNLMQGDGAQFRANDSASRAESTTVIYKVFNKDAK